MVASGRRNDGHARNERKVRCMERKNKRNGGSFANWIDDGRERERAKEFLLFVSFFSCSFLFPFPFSFFENVHVWMERVWYRDGRGGYRRSGSLCAFEESELAFAPFTRCLETYN
jgi:hypothetical protein